MIDKAQAVVDGHRQSFKMAVAHGLRIVAGTDAGGPTWALGELSEELARMVDCGMSPLTALATGTSVAGDCLGERARVGRLLEGYWGDVIAVDGRPDEQIGDLKNVTAVFLGGRRVV